MTPHGMKRKLKMTSGLSREISFVAITWNPESNCTCRKKKHFLLRRSTSTLPERLIHHWMYWWRNILKITRRWMVKENYQMHGQVSQDSFHCRGGDLRGNKRPQDPTMYGQICGSICLMRSAKQNWIIEKPKLDNARQLCGIFFIEPEDEEFKHTMKNARRKWEIPMPENTTKLQR